MQVADAQILEGWAVIGGTLLPPSRNDSLKMIYNNCPEFTHVIFIDDDMDDFTHNHILKLVADDKDVVSALTTTRRPPYQLTNGLTSLYTDQEILDHIKNKNVVEAESVGMAFTLVKRSVLDALREETPLGPIWFTTDREPRPNFDADVEDFIDQCIDSPASKASQLRDAIEYGRMAHVGTVFVGEDIAFSSKVKNMGFTIWTDCGVSAGHIGEHTYDVRHTFAYLNTGSKDLVMEEQDKGLSILREDEHRSAL
jgi:hypothetical protein